MIGIIAAVTQNGVIGIDNKIPFSYKEDLKFFKNKTIGSTVIMGRNTFESIGKPLPNRDNLVISSNKIEHEGITTLKSIDEAILSANKEKDIWLIGGSKIYQDGMAFADTIVLTITPDIELREPSVKFPWINPNKFKLIQMLRMIPDKQLMVAFYKKI